jgi:hypothetical protein
VQERGYIQKEMKLAIEAMMEIPEGQIHIIPVRLDDCNVPDILSKLHWVDIFEPDGIVRLQRSLELCLSYDRSNNVPVQSQGYDAYSELMEELITKGGLIHLDPWMEAKTEDELEFKKLLKNRWKESSQLLRAKRYQSIIELWEPLEELRYFKIDYDEWIDKPYFRCQIHIAKSHLFFAHVQLGVHSDREKHMPCAFKLLSEVLKANPYSMKGGATDRLPIEHAKVQNLNYRDTLNFANDWFKGWGGGVLAIYGISRSESERLEKRVHERLYEIDYLFRISGIDI